MEFQECSQERWIQRNEKTVLRWSEDRHSRIGLAGNGATIFFSHFVPNSRRYGPVFTNSLVVFGTILSIGFIAILDYCSELNKFGLVIV
ncbi:hypothetical protein V6N12_043585 [Hibiscus sabdariffa]